MLKILNVLTHSWWILNCVKLLFFFKFRFPCLGNRLTPKLWKITTSQNLDLFGKIYKSRERICVNMSEITVHVQDGKCNMYSPQIIKSLDLTCAPKIYINTDTNDNSQKDESSSLTWCRSYHNYKWNSLTSTS